MKKSILLTVSVVLLGFSIYLFNTDFGLLKKLVGYNVPPLTDSPSVKTQNGEGLDFLSVPDGFSVSVIAEDLTNPRVIEFDSAGRMLVSETKAGRVSVLEDSFKTRRTLIDELKSPHGLAFYKDPKTGITYLYIAETHQVTRYVYDINTGKLKNNTSESIANLPEGGNHFSRTIAFGPNFRETPLLSGKRGKDTLAETKLYISVGSSCDVCEEQTWKRAAILESDPSGTFTAEFAGGLRNSVFFTFHPETNEIWATEMGRDNLGDNLPPDEINIVRVAGPEHKFGARRYGWPFCYGNKVKDTKFNPEKIERIDIPTDCSQTEAAAIELPAHSAPLGLAFVTSDKWPDQWRNDLLVAYHGSWNRSEPTGYKIVKFKVDKDGKVSEVSDFITGWLSPDKKNVYGRPVDLKFGPDGALYISDDAAGVIYRVNLL